MTISSICSTKVTEYLSSAPGTRLGMGDTAMPRQNEVLYYLNLESRRGD